MMDEVEGKGDPVLLDCRANIPYNNERSNSIPFPYMGNNNRSPAVFEARIGNEFNEETERGSVSEGDDNINYNRFPANQLNGMSSRDSQDLDSDELTVSVQNVSKAYEDGKPVLSNLCMSVKKGTIYGLLGASGCGKSTLLSCIVGLKKWDSGMILLFNKMPNGAPGRRVGYMPQDTALYDQLSVREMIGYYGRLYGMSEMDVQKQWLWLIDFLQLPAKFKLVKELSGGQQRRVSLATCLLHNPSLLILDEPTVGLDPLLRESIWKYLLDMVETRKTTVIVTTHYIEEARFSNTIGVMRRGRLLVEDSPDTLLQLHQCDLLEQVVLKLCRKDEEVMGRGSGSSNSNNNELAMLGSKGGGKKGKGKGKPKKRSYDVQEKMAQIQESWWEAERRRPSNKSNYSEGEDEELNDSSSIFDRVRAMSTVIWLMFLRHPVFITMVLFLPTIQMILTLAVIGQHPKDLRFGVINEDMLFVESCFQNEYAPDGDNSLGGNPLSNDMANSSCNFKQLSCSLITELSKSGSLTLVPMQSVDEALEQVHKGNLWGYYIFPQNYSQHLLDFITEHKFAENETLGGSRVSVRLDMSHYLGAAFAIRDSFQAYENFAVNMAKSCGMNPKEFSLPLQHVDLAEQIFMRAVYFFIGSYREPVFGNNDGSYQDYVIPIVILTVIFEIPMLITSILFINDRKQGTLDRARVAGLHFKEVMISHFLTQGSVIIGQTAICSVVLKLFYSFHVQGCYSLYFFLLVLGGICGESLGLLLGVIFEHEVEALMVGIFLGPILLMYEGVLWPVEGMAPAIRTLAYLSPTTLTVESIRSVIYRGVGFLHGHVWPGIAIMSIWIIAFWIVSIWLFIRKQK